MNFGAVLKDYLMLMISVVLAKNGMEGEKFKKDIIYWYS
jgi:hypothetical protein